MGQVIIYCNLKAKDYLYDLPDFVIFINEKPRPPHDIRDILVVEDGLRVNGARINALRLLTQFRLDGWTGAFVLLGDVQDFNERRIWQSISIDPLVLGLSARRLREKHGSWAGLVEIFGTPPFFEQELEKLYIDYRTAIYTHKLYLSELRHGITSALNKQRDIGMEEAMLLVRKYWKSTQEYLRQYHPAARAEIFTDEDWSAILDKKTIPSLRQALSNVYQRAIDKLKIDVQLAERETVPTTILYISDKPVDRERLQERLRSVSGKSTIQLLCSSYADRHAIVDSNRHIDGILSDFRYRTEEGRLCLFNGQIVLDELDGLYGPFNLGYLTRHSQEMLPLAGRMTEEDIFNKVLLIDEASGSELHRVLQFIYRGKPGKVLAEYRWPEGEPTQKDNQITAALRDYHDKIYLYDDNRRARERKISVAGRRIVREIIDGVYSKDTAPKIRRFNTAPQRDRQFDLIMTRRRVIIGLYNIPHLRERFPALDTHVSSSSRCKFDIIFGLLSSTHHTAVPHRNSDRRSISKKTSDLYAEVGISPKKSLAHGDADLLRVITLEELNWLQKFLTTQH